MTKHYEERKEANARYLAKLERIALYVQPEEKETYRAHADQAGQSLTAYIKQAIEERIQRDQAATDHQPTQAPQAPAKPVTAQETPTPAAPATDQATEPVQEQPQPVVNSALAHIHAQEERIWAAGEMLKLKALQSKKIVYEGMLAKGTLKDWQEEDYQKTLAVLAALEDQQ